MAESTIGPSSVSIGFSPISIGNSLPSFFRPYRSRPAPIGRDAGSVKERSAQLRMVARGSARGTSISIGWPSISVAREAEHPLGLGVDHLDLARPG